MGFLSKLFGSDEPIDYGVPFMEHPSDDTANPIDAMAVAIARLRARRKWDRWITFSAQGQGPGRDTLRFAELRLLGDRIDPGASVLDPQQALADARLRRAGITITTTAKGHLLVGKADAGQWARLLDAFFCGQMGIRPYDDGDDGDYGVGAEWSESTSASPWAAPCNAEARAAARAAFLNRGRPRLVAAPAPAQPAFEEALAAVSTQDVVALRQALQAHPDVVACRDPEQRTLLVNACMPMFQVASVDVIRALVEAGSDPCARDYAGLTGLHGIVHMDNPKTPQPVADVARILVDAGLAIDAVDVHGNTALSAAVFEGFRNPTFASIDALLHLGANPRQKNNHGVSAHDLASTLQGAERLRAHLAANWSNWLPWAP